MISIELIYFLYFGFDYCFVFAIFAEVDDEAAWYATNSSLHPASSSFFNSLWANEPGPFTCPQCNRNYKRKSSLSNHMRWECGKDPQFQCPYCPQRSKQKMHIIRHVNRRHRDLQITENLQQFISPEVKLKNEYPPSYN